MGHLGQRHRIVPQTRLGHGGNRTIHPTPSNPARQTTTPHNPQPGPRHRRRCLSRNRTNKNPLPTSQPPQHNSPRHDQQIRRTRTRAETRRKRGDAKPHADEVPIQIRGLPRQSLQQRDCRRMRQKPCQTNRIHRPNHRKRPGRTCWKEKSTGLLQIVRNQIVIADELPSYAHPQTRRPRHRKHRRQPPRPTTLRRMQHSRQPNRAVMPRLRIHSHKMDARQLPNRVRSLRRCDIVSVASTQVRKPPRLRSCPRRTPLTNNPLPPLPKRNRHRDPNPSSVLKTGRTRIQPSRTNRDPSSFCSQQTSAC